MLLCLMLLLPTVIGAQVVGESTRPSSERQRVLSPKLLQRAQRALQNENIQVFIEQIQSILQTDDRPHISGAAKRKKFDLIKEGNRFVEDGRRFYVARFELTNAQDITYVHLAFRKYYYTEGTLSISDSTGENQYILYDRSTLKRGRKFATPKIPGNTILLAYSVPETVAKPDACLIIDRVGYFYKSGNGSSGALDDCYINAVCVNTHGLQNAVVKWEYYDRRANRYKVCTGTLISEDGTAPQGAPHLLTACHCGHRGELETAEFYFQYQQSSCSPGGTPIDPLRHLVVGAESLVVSSKQDIRLLRLNGLPSTGTTHTFARWNLADPATFASADVLTIHHPEGKEKAVTTGQLQGATSGEFWQVQWETDSSTGKGSSGSPLFLNGRVIGVLSKGLAGCDNRTGKDQFGKFRNAWSKLQPFLTDK